MEDPLSMNTWPLGIAANAANTTPRTIRRWMDNGVIKLKRGQDVIANGSGSYCGLSRNRILQIALTQDLIATGMSRSRAASAAVVFTDKGNAERAPGALYPFGKTLLVVDSDPHVINADFDARLSEIIPLSPCAIVVDCARITATVDETLSKTDYRKP
jgi:hypothetical protein